MFSFKVVISIVWVEFLGTRGKRDQKVILLTPKIQRDLVCRLMSSHDDEKESGCWIPRDRVIVEKQNRYMDDYSSHRMTVLLCACNKR